MIPTITIKPIVCVDEPCFPVSESRPVMLFLLICFPVSVAPAEAVPEIWDSPQCGWWRRRVEGALFWVDVASYNAICVLPCH